MPVQFQKEMMHEGKSGISTMTFSLVRYEDRDEATKKLTGQDKPPSFASMMRDAKKSYIIFRSDLYSGDVQVTFEEITSEYAEIDYEGVYLLISTKWLPNK